MYTCKDHILSTVVYIGTVCGCLVDWVTIGQMKNERQLIKIRFKLRLPSHKLHLPGTDYLSINLLIHNPMTPSLTLHNPSPSPLTLTPHPSPLTPAPTRRPPPEQIGPAPGSCYNKLGGPPRWGHQLGRHYIGVRFGTTPWQLLDECLQGDQPLGHLLSGYQYMY